MKHLTYLVTGVVLGCFLMYFIRPIMWPQQEKVKIVEKVKYKTKWKVHREITYKQAKACTFSPIIIEGKAKDDKLLVKASDGCKESRADFKVEKDESYMEEALIGVGSALLGFVGGVTLIK